MGFYSALIGILAAIWVHLAWSNRWYVPDVYSAAVGSNHVMGTDLFVDEAGRISPRLGFICHAFPTVSCTLPVNGCPDGSRLRPSDISITINPVIFRYSALSRSEEHTSELQSR